MLPGFPSPALILGVRCLVPAGCGGALAAPRVATSPRLKLVRHLMRLKHRRISLPSGLPLLLTYRVCTGHLQLEVKVDKCVCLGTGWVLGLGDLVEQSSGLVDPILTDVDMLFRSTNWPAPAEGCGIHHPTARPEGVQWQHFVQGNTEHLIIKEPP